MHNHLLTELNLYLSNVGVFYIKLHNLHWNTTGPNFQSVHEYLETLYNGFSDVFDATAETIKMQGGTPLASMKDYLQHAHIKEAESKTYSTCEALSLVQEDLLLLKSQAEDIRIGASDVDNYAIVGMLERHLEELNKTIWFLDSTLKC